MESLYPSEVIAISGYSVEENRFSPTNSDPQILFSAEGYTVASFAVKLAEPLPEDTSVDVYFAVGENGLSEKNKVTVTAPKGTKQVVLKLQKDEYRVLRLDFNGSFVVQDIGVSESVAKGRLDINGKTVGRLLLFMLVTAIAVVIVYGKQEGKRSDADPIQQKVRGWLSANLPHESLTVKERVFVLVCFISYLVWALVFLNSLYGPDEIMRLDVPKFIYENHALPCGWEESIRNPYWGTSYGFSITFPYLADVFFMRLVSLFSTAESALWIAARLTSVLSGTGIAYYAVCISKRVTKQSTRWLFVVPMALTPQIIFLSSYVNLDSFGLFTVMFLIYVWIRGMENGWDVRTCIWLGVGLGFCLLSYQFAYPYVVGSFGIYCLWHIANRKQTNAKRFFGHGFLIVGVVLLISGWYFIRNAYLYNGDLFALHASAPYAELYAVPEQKPSLKQTIRIQGYSPIGMLTETPWVGSTFQSLFYAFGYMSVFTTKRFYELIGVVLAVGAVGCVVAFIRKREKNRDLVFGTVAMTGSALLCVAISVYYSWASDYQPQGRYIIAVLPLLFAMTAYGIHHLLDLIPKINGYLQKGAVYLTVTGILLLDLKAFYHCLTQFVY